MDKYILAKGDNLLKMLSCMQNDRKKFETVYQLILVLDLPNKMMGQISDYQFPTISVSTAT